MYVPLMARDRVIGVLRINNIESKASFSQQKLSLVSTIADDAAIAIENARFYHKTEQEYLILNSILEQIEDSVIVVRPDFRVVFTNRICKHRITRYPLSPYCYFGIHSFDLKSGGGQ